MGPGCFSEPATPPPTCIVRLCPQVGRRKHVLGLGDANIRPAGEQAGCSEGKQPPSRPAAKGCTYVPLNMQVAPKAGRQSHPPTCSAARSRRAAAQTPAPPTAAAAAPVPPRRVPPLCQAAPAPEPFSARRQRTPLPPARVLAGPGSHGPATRQKCCPPAERRAEALGTEAEEVPCTEARALTETALLTARHAAHPLFR